MSALKSLLREFRDFAVKGNAIDLAVGVVIGAAFGGMVKALVDNIIMPPLGFLTGGVDFADKLIVLKTATVSAAGKKFPEVDLKYGLFLNSLLSFVIVAVSIFLVVKLMSLLHRDILKEPDPPLTTDQQLLTEIRDLLKKKPDENIG
jgi:large conductance mechanosensitive channel